MEPGCGTEHMPQSTCIPDIFHTLHGDHLKLSRDKKCLTRMRKLSDGTIAFSDQPIRIGNKVSLTVTQTNSGWERNLFIGVTCHDPGTLRKNIINDRDKTQEAGWYWISLNKKLLHFGTQITLFLKSNEQYEVTLKTGEEEDVSPRSFNSSNDSNNFWLAIDLAGNVCELALPGHQPNDKEDFTEDKNSHKTFPAAKNIGSSSTPFRFLSNPIGKDVQVREMGKTIRRHQGCFDNGIAFFDSPFTVGREISMEMTQTVGGGAGFVRFGLISTDPHTICNKDLPSRSLPDLFHKCVGIGRLTPLDYNKITEAVSPTALRFVYKADNKVHFSIGNAMWQPFLLGVDPDVTWWPFIDLYGNPTEIKIVDNTSKSKEENMMDLTRLLLPLCQTDVTGHDEVVTQFVNLQATCPEVQLWQTLFKLPEETFKLIAKEMFPYTKFNDRSGIENMMFMTGFINDPSPPTVETKNRLLQELLNSSLHIKTVVDMICKLESLAASTLQIPDSSKEQQESESSEPCDESCSTNKSTPIAETKVNELEDMLALIKSVALRKIMNTVASGTVREDDTQAIGNFEVSSIVDTMPDNADTVHALKNIAELIQCPLKEPVPSALETLTALDSDKLLVQAQTHLDSGELDHCEEACVAGLKGAVHEINRRTLEGLFLHKTAALYLKRCFLKDAEPLTFIQASVLAQAAIQRLNDPAAKDDIKYISVEIEKAFLKRMGCYDEERDSDDVLATKATHFESKLTSIENGAGVKHSHIPKFIPDEETTHEEEVTHFNEIKHLFENITNSMKEFVTEMINEAIRRIGTPPCDYSWIGLGSLARKEMTPFSDFESAILLEDGQSTETNKVYFRKLSNYLFLQVVNLGRTIVPLVAITSLTDYFHVGGEWFMDIFTKRAFSFDGLAPFACKLPTGKQHDFDGPPFELIGTPEEILEYQDVSRYPPKVHMPNTLSSFDCVSGNPEIMAKYQRLYKSYVDSPYIPVNGHNISTPLCKDTSIAKYHAIHMLKDDVEKWDVHIERMEKRGTLYHAKRELYRLSSTIIQGLCQYFGISLTDNWAAMDRLVEAGAISEGVSHHLKVISAISNEIRLLTYIQNGGQREHVTALSRLGKVNAKKSETENVFTTINRSLIERYYKTVIPLQKTMQKALQGSIEDIIQNRLMERALANVVASELYDISLENNVHVKMRLMDSGAAYTLLQKAEQKGETLSRKMKLLYAICCEDKGEMTDAKMRYLALLKELDDTNDDDAYFICKCLTLLVDHEAKMGNMIESHKFAQAAVSHCAKGERGDLRHIDCAFVHGLLAEACIRLGKAKDALVNIETAITIFERYEKKVTPNDRFFMLNQSTHIYEKLGHWRTALSISMKQYILTKNVYGSDTVHPFLAIALQNLGSCYFKLGNIKKANMFMQQSLETHYQSVESVNDYNRITITGNMGMICLELGMYDRAKYFCMQALDMIADSSYADKAKENLSLPMMSNLADYYSRSGQYAEAESCIKRAMDICDKMKACGMCGPVHPIERELLQTQVALKHCEGKPLDALCLVIDLEEMVTNMNGAESLYMVFVQQQKASVLQQAEMNEESIEAGLAAIQLCEDILGADSNFHLLWSLYNNLGNCYKNQGNISAAWQCFSKAVSVIKAHFGLDTCHPDVADITDNLGTYYLACNMPQSAIDAHTKALKMKQALFSSREGIKPLLISYNNLFAAYNSTQNVVKAQECCRQLLSLLSYLPDTAADVQCIRTMANISNFLNMNGQIVEALDCGEKAVAMVKLLCVSNDTPAAHEAKVHALHQLGIIYCDIGNFQKGIPLLEEALELENRLHPATPRRQKMMTLGALGGALINQRETPELAAKGLMYIQQSTRMEQELFKLSLPT